MSSAIRLLEDVARAKSPGSRMLTEAELYAEIEELWARGLTSIDALYNSVKSLMNERLAAARVDVITASQLRAIPVDRKDQLITIFQDLLNICRNQ